MIKTATQLSSRLSAIFAKGVDAPTSDAEFNDLARAISAFQFEHNPPYRAFCEQTLQTPDRITHWTEIPAVPAAAFRDFALTCFPAGEAVAEFHSSGTTQRQTSRHLFKTLDLYQAAAMPNFATHLLPDGVRLPVLALTQSPGDAPRSSLSRMFGWIAEDFGLPESRFFVEGNVLRVENVVHDLCEAQWSQQPVLLLGTAFAFAHLFDYLAEHDLRFELPERSRAMETGGFKGRAREMTKPELYALFEQRLGLPSWRVVNEYGMTELSSQFYDPSLRKQRRSDRKTPPPWTRVQIIDPQTNEPASPGERGLIRVLDAANLWSVMSIQTDDVGVADGNGFAVLGRAGGAMPRGCALNAEALATR